MSSKNSKSSAKPKKLKSKRGCGKNVTKTKVVVRRLPPLILEQAFFESVEQWVNKETCTWTRFHQGRISKRWSIPCVSLHKFGSCRKEKLNAV